MSQLHTFDSSLQTADNLALTQVSGGLISPDENIKDFPPWLWPVIRPGQIQFKPNLTLNNLALR